MVLQLENKRGNGVSCVAYLQGSSPELFVISAMRQTDPDGATKITCQEAVDAWKSGFTNFE